MISSNNVRNVRAMNASESVRIRSAGARDDARETDTGGFAASLAALLAGPQQPASRPESSEASGTDSDLERNVADPSRSPSAGSLAELRARDGTAVTPDNAAGESTAEVRDATEVRGATEVRDATDAAVTSVNSDSASLNGDFRTRLGRVVTRMREEFGHDVEIVEGFRPQSRQDFLYAQGRTQPGEVVTWTRSSKHTLGLAADVRIDGSYGNPAAYQKLAQLAAQEGLRTLGARDPGHIELPSRGGAVAWGAVHDGRSIDTVASRVAGMALSQSGMGAESTRDSESTDPYAVNGLLSRLSHAGARGSAATGYGSAGGGNSGGSGDTQHQARRWAEHDRAGIAEIAEPARLADLAQVARVAEVAHVTSPVQAHSPQSAGTTSMSAAHGGGGVSAAERVGQILDARDASPARPLSHVTLDLENSAGGNDRITVQLRGAAVNTAVSLSDSGRADRMSLRVGELQHALEHHGLDVGSLHVSSTASDSGAGWTPHHSSDRDAHHGQPSPNNRDNRQDADEARQRSRREQQGGKRK